MAFSLIYDYENPITAIEKSQPLRLTEYDHSQVFLGGDVTDVVVIEVYGSGRVKPDINVDSHWNLLDRYTLVDGDPYTLDIGLTGNSHIYARIDASAGQLDNGYMRLMAK